MVSRAKPPSSGQVVTRTVPAPIGGWNARDMLAEMQANEAWVMDNMIPDALGVRQRRGFAVHATGISGNFVESLMTFNRSGGNPIMFAAGPDKIYDATAAGAAVSSLTGLSNGRWQHTTFGTSGGHFLVICNGQDLVRNFDGSSWSTPSIANVTSSTLINVTSHMFRLWFSRQSTLKAYYLPPISIAGDATEFDLGPLCTKGGEIIGIASWSRDGGAGSDDQLVFLTSQGQAIIYQGTDPDSADTWGLVGRYDGPKPIGNRCFMKLGADLVVLTEAGLIPFPQYLGQSSAGVASLALTDKINGAFRDAYTANGAKFGWQVTEYPKERLLVVNVPIRERAVYNQFVINLRNNNAACQFKGMNGNCWTVTGDTLYFGGIDGKVYAYGEIGVYDDNGQVVDALTCQSFNPFGTLQTKSFKSVRIKLTGPTGYVPQAKLLMDYKHDSLPTFNPPSFTEIGPPWDETDWDVADWGASQDVTNQWRPASGTGSVASICVASKVTTPLTWNQTDIQFEVGRAQ